MLSTVVAALGYYVRRYLTSLEQAVTYERARADRNYERAIEARADRDRTLDNAEAAVTLAKNRRGR